MNTIIKEVMSLLLLQVGGGNPTFLKVKEVTECKLLKCEWVYMQTGRQNAELEAKKYGKMVEKLGCKKYAVPYISYLMHAAYCSRFHAEVHVSLHKILL
jgi:hypothetical protein